MELLNKRLNLVVLLGLLLPIVSLLYLAPVNALPVCGTITTSTYNFAGCTGGTLTIGASNINFGCKSSATITVTGSYGIQVLGQSHVNIFGCKVIGATGAGFYIYQGSFNSLTNDNATLNGAYGFEVYASFGNILVGNVAISNGQGFLVDLSNNNTLVSNKATSNQYGFNVNTSSFNDLSLNTAVSSTQTGFILESANYNSITDNTGNTNGPFGFYFDGSSIGNIVAGNAARGNSVLNADNLAGTANNFHTSLNSGIKTPYSGLQSP